MKNLPIAVVIQNDDEAIINWSDQKRELLYDLGVEAASYMSEDPSLHKIALVEFTEELGTTPYADVILSRRNLGKSLSEAIAYYVQEELYEKAAIARNLLPESEYKEQ